MRVRPAVGTAPRLLLLLHGWTGDENSMWVFMRNFSADTWTIAPRGIHPAPSGYSWRPASSRASGDAPDGRPGLENLQPAAQALLALVDSYASANAIPAASFDVIGFSQGAVLTITLALLHPERIRRAGVLAGFMPEGSQGLVEGRALQGRSLFVAHGTRDETVPVEYARRSVEALERAGAAVTYCEDEVGHKLSAGCLRQMEKFFA